MIQRNRSVGLQQIVIKLVEVSTVVARDGDNTIVACCIPTPNLFAVFPAAVKEKKIIRFGM